MQYNNLENQSHDIEMQPQPQLPSEEKEKYIQQPQFNTSYSIDIIALISIVSSSIFLYYNLGINNELCNKHKTSLFMNIFNNTTIDERDVYRFIRNMNIGFFDGTCGVSLLTKIYAIGWFIISYGYISVILITKYYAYIYNNIY